MTAPVETTRRCSVCHVAYPGTERFCSIDGGAIVEQQPAGGASRIGQTIDGRYLVRRLLGRGGMGEVYEADHVGLDKRVAIKFVTSDNTQKSALARFRREARVASRIVHEHVVHIYDVGADRGVDFIVMEYLEGKDLRETLKAEGKLEPARAISIARQMLAGLHAIHQAGILHRDIKPANVLLTTRGRDRDYVKIMDFGISKSVGDDDAAGSLTGTGNVIGTPEFIAPEMLRGAEVDHRADLYAVGITLYAMLAGEAPFVDTAFDRMIAMHLSEVPRSLDEVRPGLSPALVAAVARSLAKHPDDRFADAQAFADALGSDVAPARPSTPDVSDTIADRPIPPVRRPTIEPAVGRGRHEGTTDLSAPRKQREAPADEPVRRSRPLWPWAIAVVVVISAGAGVGLLLRKSNTPSVAVVGDAPSDASVAFDELLEHGRVAETAGRFDEALAHYSEAAKLQPSHSATLLAIAKLYDRLDRKPEAVAAYDRYLKSPDVKQSEIATVEARIKALAPPTPIDAGVIDVMVDAEVVKDEFGKPITSKPADLTCVCAVTKDAAPLCIDPGPSRCKCEVPVGELCSKPAVECGSCKDPSCLLNRCKPNGYQCPAADQIGKHGGPCTEFDIGPGSTRSTGIYKCSVCAGENPRQYHGQPGGACSGYVRETGKFVAGHHTRCTAAP